MTNASAPPLESLPSPSNSAARGRHPRRGGVSPRLLSTWERLLSRTPALEGLHINEAREALVRGAAHPLAVGLHQFSQFPYSFQIRRGGVPSPEASAPTRFCVQG